MISRTLLTATIAGLCVVGAGMAMKPKPAQHFDGAISHTGQDPVNRNFGDIPLSTTRIITGLARPVQVTHAPGDSSRIFIVEQRSGSTGRIRIFNLDTGTLNSTAFLSQTVSTSSEQGRPWTRL